MHLETTQTWKNSAVLFTGTFDPFDSFRVELVEELVGYCRAQNKTPVVVVITPHPGAVLRQHSNFPLLNGFHFVQQHLRKLGVQVVLKCNFVEKNLHSNCEDYFNSLEKFGDFSEVWVLENQTFGSGMEGNLTAILESCGKRNWICQQVGGHNLSSSKVIRDCLTNEIISKSRENEPLFFRWSRDDIDQSNQIISDWPVGEYAASFVFKNGVSRKKTVICKQIFSGEFSRTAFQVDGEDVSNMLEIRIENRIFPNQVN
jgi:FAD synthetase